MEISERIQRLEPKKDANDRSPDGNISRKQESYSKTPSGASFVKDVKVSYPTKTMNLKDVEFFKEIRQIKIRHSDLNRSDPDPFLRYWIKVYDLAGLVRDAADPGYLAHVFVDTGANCNTISRRFFDELVTRG